MVLVALDIHYFLNVSHTSMLIVFRHYAAGASGPFLRCCFGDGFGFPLSALPLLFIVLGRSRCRFFAFEVVWRPLASLAAPPWAPGEPPLAASLKPCLMMPAPPARLFPASEVVARSLLCKATCCVVKGDRVPAETQSLRETRQGMRKKNTSETPKGGPGGSKTMAKREICSQTS